MSQTPRKEKCPDCEQCQLCSESRCRQCRGEHCTRGANELGSNFTYGEYVAWKNKKARGAAEQAAVSEWDMAMEKAKRFPVIDRSECTDCESCLSLLPDIFKRNPDTGCIEIEDLPEYPATEIEQVMSMCPGDCISWQ